MSSAVAHLGFVACLEVVKALKSALCFQTPFMTLPSYITTQAPSNSPKLMACNYGQTWREVSTPTASFCHHAADKTKPAVHDEIRIVGNESAQGLSVHSGIISRRHTHPPHDRYNSPYCQVKAGAGTGSSGGPVFLEDGSVVALFCGRYSGGINVCLLLDRALHALCCIQQSKPITRGDIRCRFTPKPFHICRSKHGLSDAREVERRNSAPEATGMLVAETVLPDGESSGKIVLGDVLIKINDEPVMDFIDLDRKLDTNVGNTIILLLQRQGSDLEVTILVGDLYRLMPDRFVSVCGSNFHNIPCIAAMRYGVARGVFVCDPMVFFGFGDSSDCYIILAIDHRKVSHLDDFITQMKRFPHGSTIAVTFIKLSDLHEAKTSLVRIDRFWIPEMNLWVQNREKGTWNRTELEAPPPPEPRLRQSAWPAEAKYSTCPTERRLYRSLVRVTSRTPGFAVDSCQVAQAGAMGLVIDAKSGLVIVSRAAVPHGLCLVRVTVADSIEADGKVVFLHPCYNYAIVKYDASLVDAPVHSATLGTEQLHEGQDMNFWVFNGDQLRTYRKWVDRVGLQEAIPADTSLPQYRPMNTEAIIDYTMASHTSGVITDEFGTVRALCVLHLRKCHNDIIYSCWGVATSTILRIARSICIGEPPRVWLFPAELETMTMAEARKWGVPQEWITTFTSKKAPRHAAFKVARPMATCRSGTAPGLLQGDIFLRLNGRVCRAISDFDVTDSSALDALILRRGKIVGLQVRPEDGNQVETDHVFLFCGAVLQRPHLAVRLQISCLHSNVYVADCLAASPAEQCGLKAGYFITHVNGTATLSLASFIDATRWCANGEGTACKFIDDGWTPAHLRRFAP